MPSWMVREAMGDVIVPKVLLEFRPLAPGTNVEFTRPRLVWLSRLKNSARIWRLARSFIRLFLISVLASYTKSKLISDSGETTLQALLHGEQASVVDGIAEMRIATVTLV
jgi:hypothetical protein